LCQDGETLVLVEVKTRKSTDFGQAQEKVDWKKQKKLLLLARSLAQNYNYNDIRIDVVGVDLTGPRAKVEHIENAVEDI
jgi:putative endonuclease